MLTLDGVSDGFLRIHAGGNVGIVVRRDIHRKQQSAFKRFDWNPEGAGRSSITGESRSQKPGGSGSEQIFHVDNRN